MLSLKQIKNIYPSYFVVGARIALILTAFKVYAAFVKADFHLVGSISQILTHIWEIVTQVGFGLPLGFIIFFPILLTFRDWAMHYENAYLDYEPRWKKERRKRDLESQSV